MLRAVRENSLEIFLVPISHGLLMRFQDSLEKNFFPLPGTLILFARLSNVS